MFFVFTNFVFPEVVILYVMFVVFDKRLIFVFVVFFTILVIVVGT